MKPPRPCCALRYLPVLPIAVFLAACGSGGDAADTDKSGSRSGAANSFSALQIRFAESVHTVADLNENGEVTIGELQRVSPKLDLEKFKLYDQDNSGGISVEEATTAVQRGVITDKLRQKFDQDGDGIIQPPDQARFNELVSASDRLRNFVQVERIFEL